MSDMTGFPRHVHLEHHVLEAVVLEWARLNHEEIVTVAGEIRNELAMRDAALISANFRRSTRSPETLSFRVMRRSDGHEWEGTLERNDWLVFWLHENRLHEVEILDEESATLLFRRTRPVVILHPHRAEIEGL